MAHGDPATQEWREAVGESISAALRRVERERDEAVAAQARIGDRLTETVVRLAAHRQDRERLQRDLAASQADLTRAEQDLAEAREERDEARHELAHARFQLDMAKTRLDNARQHDGKPCAWRQIAVDVMREQPGGIYPARQDVGPCVLCGQLIVRGHWVEARHDSTTKPEWAHAHGICPDKETS